MKIKKNVSLYLMFGGLFLSFFFDRRVMELFSNKYPNADETNILFKYYDPEVLNFIFKKITKLPEGSGLIILVVSLIGLGYYFKDKKYYLLLKNIFNSYIVSGIISWLLKVSFMRERPFVSWNPKSFHSIFDFINGTIGTIPYKNKYLSFPSGHTTSAFAVFTLLMFSTRNRVLKIIFLAMALLIAFSRIYLSKHYLSDIMFGIIIGYNTSKYFATKEVKEKRRQEIGYLKVS